VESQCSTFAISTGDNIWKILIFTLSYTFRTAAVFGATQPRSQLRRTCSTAGEQELYRLYFQVIDGRLWSRYDI